MEKNKGDCQIRLEEMMMTDLVRVKDESEEIEVTDPVRLKA